MLMILGNKLEKLSSLSNRYFILRHGHSEANEKKIIVSNPENGIPQYGLTNKGKKDVNESISTAINSKILSENCVIYSSPFKRTKETAEIASELLGIKEVGYELRLRERFFGEFELKGDDNYNQVWEEDILDSAHNVFGVESVQEVIDRVTTFVSELEEKHKNQDIIMVLHGDIGQISECAFTKKDPRKHRELVPLVQAELREMKFNRNL